MRKIILLLTAWVTTALNSFAGRISGTVSDEKGEPLAYASVFVKGTTLGTTTNSQGKFFIDLDPGQYIIVCQYVGYARQEKAVNVTDADITLDFTLSIQQTTMKEVTVKANREDPAYEIIRNAIKKRKEYLEPLDSFTCEAYIKTLVKTRKMPKRVFGQKIEDDDLKEMGLDSSGKGILFLSESLTKIAYKKPNKIKLQVISGRQSGSGGYGFNWPVFINFYNNNVVVLTSQFNRRGFVSPVADGALSYYRYKYLGTFWEDGREVNRIEVIPRRKFEPLFEGTICITEGDWRIHSLELQLTRESQLELLDTIRIKQIQVPVTPNIWQTKDQVVYFTFNKLGFDAVGNFVNVYNQYETKPRFGRKYFNNIIATYDTNANRRSMAYWDSIRPVQLEPEEIIDYLKKDSIHKYRRDSVYTQAYSDSMRRRQGRITLGRIFWEGGFTRSNFNPKKPFSWSWVPLARLVLYNTVEGLVTGAEMNFTRKWPSSGRQLSFTPHVRYGLSNTHFNAWGDLALSRSRAGTDSSEEEWDEYFARQTRWILSGGKQVSQFNKAEPISPFVNAVYTLFSRENYMKIYENWFGQLQMNTRFDNGLNVSAGILYEDRLPVDNTTNYSFFGDKEKKQFTPNYPFEKIEEQFARHQAVIVAAELSFQPGQKYVQYPRSRMPIGSKYPVLGLSYQAGIDKLLGSDVAFQKWQFTVTDDLNLKLRGLLKYRFGVGGFLNRDKVFIQDYQHFNGNQLIFAGQYLNSFQLAPYYGNSTTESFYAIGHLEHHFNGLLTNKIPLFRRLNWHLVGGANAFFVNRDNNYVEVFAGLENILKFFRVDIVASYLNGNKGEVGVRIGFGGLLGGVVQTQ